MLSREKNKKRETLTNQAISQPGCYLLLLRIEKNISLRVGKLGSFYLKAGYYAYAGSARRGLKGRITRYLSPAQKCFWHIDYLLRHPEVRLEGLFLFPGVFFPEFDEHILIKKLLENGSKAVIPGFGSRDCREQCPAHLVKIPRKQKISSLFPRAIILTRLSGTARSISKNKLGKKKNCDITLQDEKITSRAN